VETYAISGSTVTGLEHSTSAGITCGGYTTDQMLDAQAQQQQYTAERIESKIVQPRVSGQLTSGKSRFEVKTTLGPSVEIYLASGLVAPLSITLSLPEEAVPVNNPEMRVVTAFVMTLENYHAPEQLEVKVPVPADDLTGWLFVRYGDIWVKLDGKREGDKVVVKLTSEQILQYFKGDDKISALFAVLSVVDPNEIADKVVKIYDGGGETAVIFVQGITTTRMSVKRFVQEYQMARDPSKVYAYYYTPTKDLPVLAKTLAEQASNEILKDGIKEVYLVPYSFGGLVAQDALTYAKQNHLALAALTNKVVYVGTPFGGTPVIDVWNRFFSYIANTKVSAGLLGVEEDVLNVLVTGKQEPGPSVEAEYGLVIGTRTYPFTSTFFDVTNDGVVDDPSAHPQWFIERKYCDPNVLRVDLTHDQLPGAWPVRDFVYKLTNKDKIRAYPNAPILGYSQSVDVKDPSCQPGDVIVIVADKGPEESRPQACGCGDNVCGLDENAQTCPQDCADVWQSLNLCLFLPWGINAILMLLLIVSAIYIFKEEKTHEKGKGFIVLSVILGVIFLMVLAHYIKCEFLLPFALAVLGIIALMIIITILHFNHVQKDKAVYNKYKKEE
jgi:hypothetical protein